MSNLLGENFKPYVAKQIKTRQDILGRRESGVLSDSNSNKAIMWENGNSSYIALASSIDIKNSPIFISKVSSVIVSKCFVNKSSYVCTRNVGNTAFHLYLYFNSKFIVWIAHSSVCSLGNFSSLLLI